MSLKEFFFIIKYHRLIGIPILLVGLISGCDSSSDPKTLEFWAMGVEGEHVRELMPRFEKETGLKVVVQSIPWTAAHEKLLTAFAGNTMPDIFQLGNTWIPEFEALDALEKLQSYLDSSRLVHAESYFPGIWETNYLDSILYGIPWYVDTRVMFYRRDLLSAVGYDQFPRSWSQLLNAAQRLVHTGQAEYGILLPTNEWAGPVILGLQKEVELLRRNNCYANFSGEKFLEAFRFFMSFYEQNLCPVGMTAITNIYQGFETNYFAMLITGPWNIGEFTRRLAPENQSKWMTAPLPAPQGKKYPGVSLAGGSSLVIYKGSNKKDQVWQLLEYLSSPAMQVEFYQLTGDLPARMEAWQDSVILNNPYTSAFYKQLQHVRSTPRIPEWEQIALKLQQYVEVAAYGKMPPQEAMKKLDREVNQILEKRRWLLNPSKEQGE